MNKKEFLEQLAGALRGYYCDDAVRYYDELISDKIDSGVLEHDAVASLGNVSDVVAIIKAERVEATIKENTAKNPFKTFITLTALCTSPVLLGVAIAFTVTYLALFITFFAVGISLMAGCIGTAVMIIVNAIYAAGTLGFAGVVITIGAGAVAAGILGLLGIGFYKLSMYFVKGFLVGYAKIISKSKRRKINENTN